MRNAFIVSVESVDGITAKGLAIHLSKAFSFGSGVRCTVEEGDYKTVANIVRDYLEAEEALEKFTAENHVTVGQDLSSPTGEKWMVLYDKVREKRNILVSKLREYGCVV